MKHKYKVCTGIGCRGCHQGLDCIYEALAICEVCGGMEGSLLPDCPGVMQTAEQDKQNYADYCAGTGPFADPTADDLLPTLAKRVCACGERSAPLVEGAYCRRCHKPTVVLITS